MQPEPEQPRPASIRPGFVEAGLLAGLSLALVEQLAVGPTSPALAWVIAALCVALATAAGLVLQIAESAISRLRLRGFAPAIVRTSPSLIVSIPVARTLFEGAFASQLPGASSAHTWLPAIGWGVLALVVHVGQRWQSSHTRQRWLGAGLVLCTAGLQLLNRNVKTSELMDLHTGLAVASLVTLLLGVRALGWPRLPARRAALWRGGLVVLVAANAAMCLRVGLDDPADRWTVATHGTDTRLYVRMVRALLDTDADEYAAVLGGGDCDDEDPARNPGAPEIPDNGIDEDCDGLDATADRSVAARTTEIRADLDAWSHEDATLAFLARTRELDVLLISIDALRADMLADTPENRRDFPALLALSAESIHFTRAFAPAAGTDLSMSTILTGRIDPFAGVERTLAESLRESGRQSHAVIPSEVLRYAGKALLTRGFDDFDRLINDRFEQDVGNYSTSERATELALAGIDAIGDARQFGWVHYFDVHEHAELDLHSRRLREILGEQRLETTRDRYRAAVALVDRALGQLMAGLRERGRLEHTLVVLVSDHGESLGEDPRLPANHGLYVYNPLVHVPLLVRVPGLPAREVDTPVSLVDVAPTIAQLAGAPLAPVDGTSLLAALLPDAPPELANAIRPIVLNESDQHGVIVWPLKLMRRPAENLVELYDLDTDFAELEDLAPSRPDRVRELLAVYHAHPTVHLDRTRRGRRARELAARSGSAAAEAGE